LSERQTKLEMYHLDQSHDFLSFPLLIFRFKNGDPEGGDSRLNLIKEEARLCAVRDRIVQDLYARGEGTKRKNDSAI
jgi:hypothetical protein